MAGWANVPAGKNKYDRLTRGGVTKYWSPGPLGLGGSYQTAATLNAQRQKEGKKPIDFTKIGVPKSTPTPAPTQTFQNTGGYGKYTPPSTQVKTPAPAPAPAPAQRTLAPAPAQRTLAPAPAQRTLAPAPTPFGRTMPAPAAADLDKYKINKDWAAANPRLAQAQVKRAEQRASGRSVFDPEFRKSTINPILYKPGALKAEETMTKDSYDLVLEYLLSTGHADTLLEAQYVMMQMSAEHIQNIVEAEVLAMKGGVPGSVKVKPALSIPGTDIGIGPNKPVPGTFTTTTPGQREKIAKGDTTIDRGTYQQSRVGAGPTSAERQRYNAELIKQGKHTAPRMPQ